MMMKLDGNSILIKGADKVQFSVIKSWNMMTWNKKEQVLRGPAEPELLDKLASMVKLTAPVEARRIKAHAIQDAVDRERMDQNPEPLYKYPVKMPLYAHQVRGANMCLLTFGWAEPERKEGVTA